MMKDVKPQEIVENLDGKTIVMFHADWCGPCQMTKPVIKEIAEEGTANILLVNIDEDKEGARQFGVSGIPALFFYDGENRIGEHTGFAPKEVILKGLEG